MLQCEQGSRSVTRIEPDGSLTVLADTWQGQRLNSPNDVVERTDGSIWFTDPSYGIDSDYEGVRAAAEIEGCHVYRRRPRRQRDRGRQRLRASQRSRLLQRRGHPLRRRHPPQARPPLRRAAGPVACPVARCSRPATPARSTASASMRSAGSGSPPTTACTASTPTAPARKAARARDLLQPDLRRAEAEHRVHHGQPSTALGAAQHDGCDLSRCHARSTVKLAFDTRRRSRQPDNDARSKAAARS